MKISPCALVVAALFMGCAPNPYGSGSQSSVLQYAIQNQYERNRQRDELVVGVGKECEDKRVRGELSGHVEEARCGNDRLRAIHLQSGFPHMDLVDLYLAYRTALAKRIDEKVLSEEEAKLQLAELKIRINGEIRRRNAAASQRLLDALILQSLLPGQGSSLYEAGRILAEPLPSSPRPPVPTIPPPINCVSIPIGGGGYSIRCQ